MGWTVERLPDQVRKGRVRSIDQRHRVKVQGRSQVVRRSHDALVLEDSTNGRHFRDRSVPSSEHGRDEPDPYHVRG